MKIFTPLKTLALMAALFITPQFIYAGDGTKTSPYTVAELNAQKNALATSGATVWVKASLKGLGEDGTKTDNYDTEDAKGKTIHPMAALFEDATGTFVAYSYQILNGIALTDFTNKNDLLISLTYGTAGHPYGNSANPQYATDYEKDVVTDNHFSLDEVHGALSVTVSNGLRGFHFPASYIVPKDIVVARVNFNYNQTSGASINYGYYDGAEEGKTYIITKGTALIWLAYDGTYDVTLSAGYYEQINSNGLNGGTQAGVNAGTTADRWRFRFVNDGTKLGFERNSDDNCTVILDSKEEVYLQVNSKENHFGGHYAWETADKKWISWTGKKYSDYHAQATEVTFDFANNNLNFTYGENGTADQQNAGNLAGKKLTLDGVTMTFVNSPSIAVRTYNLASKGQHFQIGAKNGKLRITAPEGRAITKIVVTQNLPESATNFVKWEVDKGEGTLSQDKKTWEGNSTSVRFNSTGSCFINAITVTLSPINSETITPATDEYTTEVSTLAELNALPAGTLVKLNLNNVIVTTEFASKLGYYIQDATAGTALYATGLTFNLHDILNGYVYLNRADNEQKVPGNRAAMAEDTNADHIQVTADGTFSAVEGTTVAAINIAANLCKVVQLNNVKVKGTSKTAATITDSAEGTINISNPGNGFATSVYTADLTNLDMVDAAVVGILYAGTSGNQIYPISITDTPAGINNITAGVKADDAVIYNLKGQRFSGLQKGLNIVNGKKILVK